MGNSVHRVRATRGPKHILAPVTLSRWMMTCCIATWLPSAVAGDGPAAFRARGAVTARPACGYQDGPRNLLARTIDFPVAGWTPAASGAATPPEVRPNAGTAPDGSGSAARIVFPSPAQAMAPWHSCIESTVEVQAGQAYTFSFSVKGPEGARIGARGAAGGESSVIPLDGRWQRVHLTEVATGGPCAIRIGMTDAVAPGTGSSAADGILLWGPQLVLGRERVPYQPTTGPAPPMYPLELVADGELRTPCPPDGVPEGAATNLLCWSNDLGDRSWRAVGIEPIAGMHAVAPTGLGGAQRIRESKSPGPHGISQSFRCPAGVPLVASVYVRPEGRSHCMLTVAHGSGSDRGRFELPTAAGTPFCVGAGTRIETVGQGWYRLQVATTAPAAADARAVVSLSLLDQLAGDHAYEGDGRGSILVWGPQVEVGTSATSHIPTFFVPETRQADEPVTVPSR